LSSLRPSFDHWVAAYTGDVGPIRRLEHEYRVRFDEADANGRLRPSGLLRYAQDMAWRHSEEAGFGREWYAERDMHWLVRNVTLRIRQRVTYGDVLAVGTEVTGWRHVWARRRTDIRRVGSSSADGEVEALMATVETDWVLLTLAGRPAKVPAEIAHYFAQAGPFTRERVVLPATPAAAATLETRVRPLDVDPMRHMNNAAYVDAVDDAMARLPQAKQLVDPACYRIGYLRPALPGTAVVVRSWPLDVGQVACRISDAEGGELTKALVSRSAG
jgi:acyl-CoA thioesterase FadM